MRIGLVFKQIGYEIKRFHLYRRRDRFNQIWLLENSD